MKALSLLIFIASAFSLILNLPSRNPFEGINFRSLISPAPPFDSKPDSKTLLGKREYTLEQYQADHPQNQIPEYVTVSGPNGAPPSVMYSRQDIWNAFVAGWWYIENPSSLGALAWGGRRYPHSFGGQDAALQQTAPDHGAGDWNNVRAFPIAPSGPHGIVWDGNRRAQGPDRVLFDTHGNYMGIVTHRGESNNRFHWGVPTTLDGNLHRVNGVPGYPDGIDTNWINPGHDKIFKWWG